MSTLAGLAAHAHRGAEVPDVLCTLLYLVFVVAIVIAVVALILGLVTRLGAGNPRWSWAPWGWLYPAAVALVAGLLLLLLC